MTFEPNPAWSEFYAEGPEIQKYYESVVRNHGIDKHIKFETQISRAVWLVEDQQWHVYSVNLATGRQELSKADFFISAAGRLNEGTLPNIEGLETFQGHIRHSTNWDHEYDYTGKKVAIIGSGASGMQILPNLLPKVEHIDQYTRSKNWVSPFFKPGLPTAGAENPGGHRYTEEEKTEWIRNPESYLKYRKELDVKFYGPIDGMILGSPQNAEFRKKLEQLVIDRTGGNLDLASKLIPDFAPGCKRLTPAPGYIEALLNPKVDFVTDGIASATATGLVGKDGKHREVDAIIAATGFTGDYRPRFSIIGLDGVDIRDQWGPDGPIGYPDTYLGVMAPGFPNFFVILQAQGTATGGVVPLQCEISATYIAKCIRKIQSQSYTSLHPTIEAAEEFNAVVDGFFDARVTSDSCSSWWKVGKGKTRHLASWPGSGYHRFDNLREPRWEDFIFKRAKRSEKNRFDYFGNGFTEREKRADPEDLTKYLKPVGQVDLKTLHESWTD